MQDLYILSCLIQAQDCKSAHISVISPYRAVAIKYRCIQLVALIKFMRIAFSNACNCTVLIDASQ